MMLARRTVAAEAQIEGVTVQVVDFWWGLGDALYQQDSDVILSYRVFPLRVGVDAGLAAGARATFGQLMFFPSGTEVNTLPSTVSERVRNILCRFEPQWFDRICDAPRCWSDESLAACFNISNSGLQHHMQRLAQEVISPGFASDLMINSLATASAIEVARHFSAVKTDLRVRTRSGLLSRTDLARIIECIESAEGRPLTIHQIAERCGVSSAHLRRSFKQTTGETIHAFVDSVRYRRAQEMMANTDLPLKEVAFRLGFANPNTFSTAFRKISGETAGAYRARLRSATSRPARDS